MCTYEVGETAEKEGVLYIFYLSNLYFLGEAKPNEKAGKR